MKTRNPVSRVDSKRTHGFYARVYRGAWVGLKSFADRRCGGRDVAERAAWSWQRRVDRCLPVIPRKPVLKVARFTLRKDKRGRHYDVYLPLPGRGVKPESRQLRFKKIENMEKQARKARELVMTRNAQLVQAHRLSMAAWKRERDRIMQEILRMWPDAKKMKAKPVVKTKGNTIIGAQ